MRLQLLVFGLCAALAAGAAIDPMEEKFNKVKKTRFESHQQMMKLQKLHPRLCLINKDGIKWIVYDFFDILPKDIQEKAESILN